MPGSEPPDERKPSPPPPPWPLGVPENVVPPPESMRQEAARLLKLLGRMPELEMRASVLAESVRRVTTEEAATLIAELLRSSLGHAHGAAVRVALTVALGDPRHVPTDHMEGIRQDALERGDQATFRLLLSRDSHRGQQERMPPPPAGSPSRELSLGERRALARRPDRNMLERLVLDPEPMVIRNLLRNPRLTEEDVLRVATRRPIRSDVLAEIHASRRWICRPRIQLALVLNPYNRSDISLRLLELLPRRSLRQVAGEGTLDPVVRQAASAALGGASRGE